MAKVKPLLSILIPTKNREAYLGDAIRSALSLDSDSVEILVSENHSSDNSLGLCREFNDPRLRVLRPVNPLPMHSNWELLLRQSTGEWVTFIGDDDAILPSALASLREYTEAYPSIEQIYSPRSYYFWTSPVRDTSELRFPLCRNVIVESSRDTLISILNGQLSYLYGPQIYSGGFQRRTLIDRIFRGHGSYFNVASPDAASSLFSLLYTVHFIRVGRPMTIVGTSPPSFSSGGLNAKDRYEDFIGAIESSLGSDFLHPIIRNGRILGESAAISFLETVLSSVQAAPLHILHPSSIRRLFLRGYIELGQKGMLDLITELATHSGFSLPTFDEIKEYEANFPILIPDPMPSAISHRKYLGLPSILDAVRVVESTLSD